MSQSSPSAPDTDLAHLLPDDGLDGTLIGRVWLPASLTGSVAGPSPVLLTDSGVYDLSLVASTSAELLANDPVLPAHVLADPAGAGLQRLGDVGQILRNTLRGADGGRDEAAPYFLAPIDLQAIKACGVTFASSLLERLIEERTQGDAAQADSVRADIEQRIGGQLSSIVPGSAEAAELKAVLSADGLWSPYLEVGLGPDAEVFTKSQPLSAVGTGDAVGIHPASEWNNPEPEVVLLVDPRGNIRGATLGNDVNLRDIEGRSALLLGKAKDNNASCAIGPFIRLFDNTFGLDDVRQAEVSLHIQGSDGFRLEATSRMGEISRDVTDLVSQTMGPCHQYPDGLALFTGTLFAPTQDRKAPGQGFTHELGDLVEIRCGWLGTLRNTVTTSDRAAPWEVGLTALMHNLSRRGLLTPSPAGAGEKPS